jgi:hypothetical protein
MFACRCFGIQFPLCQAAFCSCRLQVQARRSSGHGVTLCPDAVSSVFHWPREMNKHSRMLLQQEGHSRRGHVMSAALKAKRVGIVILMKNAVVWDVTPSVVPSSPILVSLMTGEIRSSETSDRTRATRRNIPEDSIFHSHSREDLKSYIALPGWTL